MTTIIKIRRDTAANWTSANPILASGEPGLETDTLALKYGDGVTEWNDLDYSSVANAVFATSAGTANVALSVDVANVANIGNIATVNLDGNIFNALRGDGSFGPVDSAGTSINNGLTSVSIPTANGNIILNVNDGNAEWTFGTDGSLTLPDGAPILFGGNNCQIQAAQAFSISSEGGIAVEVTDKQWLFDPDGNLTLPGNTFAVNYANGSQVPLGGGGSGFTLQYEVAPFVANTQPGFGEIQFSDNSAANANPTTAQKLFINEGALNEQGLGTILQQWTSNSYRGTLSLNNGSDQATFNISQGGVYFDPEVYRGFSAGLNQIWGDDCSINQLIITNATAPKFYNTSFDLEDDVFHSTGLGTGNTHVMLNVYGSSQYNPINPQNLWSLFTSFVDNVLYNGVTLRTDTSQIKTQFYNNTGNFRGEIPTQDYYQWFEFPENAGADYFESAPTTTDGGGTGATLRIRVNPIGTYVILGIAGAGQDYIIGDALTVSGAALGGATPANDLVLSVANISLTGGVTEVTYVSGTGVYPWPSNYINDGGDDQYDTGNYINTNLDTEISYGNGEPQIESAAFGSGDYCVMYNQSIFCMVTTDSDISDLFYSGDLGFDGDGFVRWTGLRSTQNVIPNNQARYAYFDSEYLDGDLTIANGVTYNMNLDSAGIDLDGFYSYYDNNVNDYFFGSNNTWRVESQSSLFVQSYNDMFIQTRVNQRGTGEAGPSINISASDGSPGQREINATAGNGGTVYVRGGDAGDSDGILSLGNAGGGVDISGGSGSGNSNGGTVNITGGSASGNGVPGNVSISSNSNIWAFNASGTLTFPGNGYITNPPNSSLDPNISNVSTMVFTPDQNYTSQSLVLDPTGPSHIHLRAPGANIDEPDANIFLGGETSSFEVGYYNGSAPEVFIHSNNKTWTFDTTGILVFPRDTGPNTTDPILNIIGGANPTITSSDASLAGPANLGISALNTIFTGSSGDAITIYPDDGEISGDANIQIWTNAVSNTQYSWTFGDDGNLTLPGNLVIAGNTSVFGTNASLIQTTDGLPLLSVSSGSNGGVSSLWAEDIGNIGTSNIAAVYANPTSGSKIVRIAVGQNGNGGPSLWDFDNAGNLTLPTSGHIIVSGGIVSSGASPAPTLSGFSSVGAQQFTNGNSNVTVNANSNTWTFDSTGNLIIPGSSGGFIKTVANSSIGIAAVDNGTNNPAQLMSFNVTANAPTTIVSAYATNALIQTNATGAINTWSFDSAGNLTLPGNTFAVKYANGTQVSLAGSSISNGNSNVSIATSNGNVVINAVGNATITVTGTGANITGTLTSTGKIGYASGATVTQATNRSQGVTINSLAGTIITTSAVMVPNQVDAIAVNNNQVDPATDIVHAQVVSYHNGCYLVTPLPTSLVGNGFYLYLKNIDTFNTANEAVTIRFMVIKAPNA